MRKSLLFPSYISPNLKLLSVWFEFQTRLAWEKCSSTFWFSDIQFSEITHSILNCQAQTPTDNLKWDSQTQSQPEVMYPSSFIYVPSLSIQGCYLYVFHTAMNWLKQRWSFTLHKYEILLVMAGRRHGIFLLTLHSSILFCIFYGCCIQYLIVCRVAGSQEAEKLCWATWCILPPAPPPQQLLLLFSL